MCKMVGLHGEQATGLFGRGLKLCIPYSPFLEKTCAFHGHPATEEMRTPELSPTHMPRAPNSTIVSPAIGRPHPQVLVPIYLSLTISSDGPQLEDV
jgi:hypothetical protein